MKEQKNKKVLFLPKVPIIQSRNITNIKYHRTSVSPPSSTYCGVHHSNRQSNSPVDNSEKIRSNCKFDFQTTLKDKIHESRKLAQMNFPNISPLHNKTNFTKEVKTVLNSKRIASVYLFNLIKQKAHHWNELKIIKGLTSRRNTNTVANEESENIDENNEECTMHNFINYQERPSFEISKSQEKEEEYHEPNLQSVFQCRKEIELLKRIDEKLAYLSHRMRRKKNQKENYDIALHQEYFQLQIKNSDIKVKKIQQIDEKGKTENYVCEDSKLTPENRIDRVLSFDMSKQNKKKENQKYNFQTLISGKKMDVRHKSVLNQKLQKRKKSTFDENTFSKKKLSSTNLRLVKNSSQLSLKSSTKRIKAKKNDQTLETPFEIVSPQYDYFNCEHWTIEPWEVDEI